MNNYQNICNVILLFFLVTTTGISCVTIADTSVNLDRGLIKSLAKNDLQRARILLEQGANPEAILGKNLNQNAMCTAIDHHNAEKLELLVEFGASPNAFWDNAHVTQRTPLVCAIEMWNFEAFLFLLNNGADPSVDLFPEGLEKFRYKDTSFTNAIGYSAFPMALELLKRYTLRPNEIEYAVNTLETSPFDDTHPWNYARDEIIDWLSHRVSEFNPVKAGKGRFREKNECYFSARDRRERLKKGTVCPPPE